MDSTPGEAGTAGQRHIADVGGAGGVTHFRMWHMHIHQACKVYTNIFIKVYTNKQMLVGVNLDVRQYSTTAKSADNGTLKPLLWSSISRL